MKKDIKLKETAKLYIKPNEFLAELAILVKQTDLFFKKYGVVGIRTFINLLKKLWYV